MEGGNEAKILCMRINILIDLISAQQTMIEYQVSDPKHLTLEYFNELTTKADLEQHIESLMEYIEKLLNLQSPESQWYNRVFLVKAMGLRCKVIVIKDLQDKIDLLKEIATMVEPYNETSAGIFLYLSTMIQLQMCYYPLKEYDKGVDVLTQAKDAYDTYNETVDEPYLTHSDLLGLKSSQGYEDRSLDFEYQQIAFGFWNLYFNKAENEEIDQESKCEYAVERFKYVMPAINYIATTMKRNARLYTCFQHLHLMISDLVDARQFKQVDHLLSGAMFHLVNYRKSLPEEEQVKLNYAQGKFSTLFAAWGLEVLEVSYERCIGNEPKYDPDSYEEIEYFKQPGVELYAQQFPFEPIKLPLEIMGAIKRALIWNNRAIESLIGYVESEDELDINLDLEKSLNNLQEWFKWLNTRQCEVSGVEDDLNEYLENSLKIVDIPIGGEQDATINLHVSDSE